LGRSEVVGSLDDVIEKSRAGTKRGQFRPQRGGRNPRGGISKQYQNRPTARRTFNREPMGDNEMGEDGDVDMMDGSSWSRGMRFRRGVRRTNPPAPPRIVSVSNLDFSIMKDDLEELFESVGPVQRCWVNYDKTDRSKGTGGVIFEDHQDAVRAIEQYNGRLIEGQPLHLEFRSPRY